MIAREIHRRLLPAYRAELASAAQRAARLTAQDHQRGQVTTGLLAALPGATAADDTQGHATTVRWPYSPAAGRGSIRLAGDGSTGSAELTSVPAALLTAVAVAVASADHAAGPPP